MDSTRISLINSKCYALCKWTTHSDDGEPQMSAVQSSTKRWTTIERQKCEREYYECCFHAAMLLYVSTRSGRVVLPSYGPFFTDIDRLIAICMGYSKIAPSLQIALRHPVVLATHFDYR